MDLFSTCFCVANGHAQKLERQPGASISPNGVLTGQITIEHFFAFKTPEGHPPFPETHNEGGAFVSALRALFIESHFAAKPARNCIQLLWDKLKPFFLGKREKLFLGIACLHFLEKV